MTQIAPDPRIKPMAIAGELRRRINLHAHAEGQKHERELRDRLIADLQKRAATGARWKALNAYLDSLLTRC